jgi:hypothetical protein
LSLAVVASTTVAVSIWALLLLRMGYKIRS